MTPLALTRLPLALLRENPNNPRLHNDENLAAIRASLVHFGQVEPLVVQASTRTVIGGNGRLAVMRDLGWPEATVVELPLDDAQASALGVALNRTASLATWDAPALTRLLAQLQGEGLLDAAGYSPAALDALVAEVAAAAGPRELEDPGAPEPPARPVSRAGDLWLLGEHRLLCGDTTHRADVERVLAGATASLCATDPPYLVDYTGERPNDSGKDWTATYREIDIEDAGRFFRATFENVKYALAPHAAIYCWHAHRRCGEIQRVWQELGILDHQQIIWVKPSPVFGFVYWHFRHEPCMLGWVAGSKPPHDGQHEHDSVWEVDYDGKARSVGNEHPTSKPVELFARPIRKHTHPGDLVFEPFSGSGSQLIAAERERRRCAAIEISPAYVDVAIARWQGATGQEAVLEIDGRPWSAVASERLAT